MAVGRCAYASGVGLLVGLSACTVAGDRGLRVRATDARDSVLAARLNGEGLALVDQGDCALAESTCRSSIR